ncbi:MAG: apolipoprotein N-acyltransferase [Nitrospirota bacterium]|nr:apolipoprotein N-acyltransferase [Nitrospirota bacterium]
MDRRSLVLAGIAGLLIALSFPSADIPLLAWFGLVPLLLALRDRTPKEGFWLGALFGIVYFGGTVYWVINSVHFYGHIPLVPAALITLLLCSYNALYPALFGAIISRLRAKRPALIIIAAPAVWTGLELARTYVFSGFPWSLLGYSQYRMLPLIQFSDITGVYGVSFLIVLVNALAAGLIEDRKRYLPAIAGLAVLVAAVLYGYVRLQQSSPAEGIRISVIQGNIEQDKKWDPAYQSEVLAAYERLTKGVLEKKPDLVIWPETATPFYFNGNYQNDPAMTRDLKTFVRGMDVPLLFGSPFYERTGERSYILRNTAYLLDRSGETAAIYHKIHLVPFGEYVPLKDSLLFFVNKMVQAIGDFQGGTEYTVMKVRNGESSGKVAVGTVICYEIIFPDLVRRFVDQGATVMTTITNDAWFGRTAAPYQHFSMAVFRAVENRVPVARAANTGISGFIDAQGRILETSQIFTEAALTRTVTPSDGSKTFYTRYGDVFAYLCGLASLVLLVNLPKKTANTN